MELIGTLQNPPQICTDYLHEAGFAQRNTLLFVWLIPFGKSTALLLHAWTPRGFALVEWNLHGKQPWMQLGLQGCGAGTLCGPSPQCSVDQPWEQPRVQDFQMSGSLVATTACAKELAKISRQKKKKNTKPKKPTPNSDNWSKSHSLVISTELL